MLLNCFETDGDQKIIKTHPYIVLGLSASSYGTLARSLTPTYTGPQHLHFYTNCT